MNEYFKDPLGLKKLNKSIKKKTGINVQKAGNKFFGLNTYDKKKSKPSPKPLPKPIPQPSPPEPPSPPPVIKPQLSSANFPENNKSPRLFSHIYCLNNSNISGNFFTKSNNDFGNDIKNYKELNQRTENSCLNECNKDTQCAGYVYNISKNNCKLYNNIPTVLNSNHGVNSGYKYNYDYKFSLLNENQKNVVKKDCLNTYICNNYSEYCEDKLNDCFYNLRNSNSIGLNVDCVKSKVNENTIKKNEKNNVNDNNINKNSITDPDIDNFVKNYELELQTQTNLLQNDNQTIYNNSESNIKDVIKNEFNETKEYLKKENELNNERIKASIIGLTESFSNFNDNDYTYNNSIKIKKLVLLIILIIIIFFIIRIII